MGIVCNARLVDFAGEDGFIDSIIALAEIRFRAGKAAKEADALAEEEGIVPGLACGGLVNPLRNPDFSAADSRLQDARQVAGRVIPGGAFAVGTLANKYFLSFCLGINCPKQNKEQSVLQCLGI